MLLPLTSSVYVAGELASTDTVLVNIGTGYYMEVCILRGVYSLSSSEVTVQECQFIDDCAHICDRITRNISRPFRF